MRLDAFVKENRTEIIERCREKVRLRRAPRPTDLELERGIPLFLDQLVETLHLRRDKNPDAVGGATRHGSDLLRSGFTVAQVVHDYGDVCQSVTELAIERNAPIVNEDFRTLNRCLDDAIADAVTEFTRLRDVDMAEESAREANERLGVLAHEVRNIASSITLAFDVVKSGRVGMGGATGAVLERSLGRLNSLVSRSLTAVRLEVGTLHRERVEVASLFEELEIPALLGAKAKGVMFSVVLPAERGLAVDIDTQIVASVLVNLIQNAVKFTRDRGHVLLSARSDPERVMIDVTDECGGLPPGADESLFRAFEQRGNDRTGVGLGLAIAARGAQAHGGKIHVRDVPGTGCVFTLDLPRAEPPAATS
jgi:signal transduction histidine kinase